MFFSRFFFVSPPFLRFPLRLTLCRIVEKGGNPVGYSVVVVVVVVVVFVVVFLYILFLLSVALSLLVLVLLLLHVFFSLFFRPVPVQPVPETE